MSPRISIGVKVMVAVSAMWLGACAGEKKPEAREVMPVLRDVPSALRGTIGSEAKLNGIDPVLVAGIGLVVGLDGTGGGPYPAPVQATMEREIGRRGMGRATMNESHALAGMSAQQILASRSVAIVVVEGVIPPGAPKDAPFDVRVRAMPGSATTSLEGGNLWSTDLRIGAASVFGQAQARVIAGASGSVYINPFALQNTGDEASNVSPDGVVRTIGRVLGGGTVTDPLALELSLDNASHAKAAAMQNAINTRFPQESGQSDPTARGRNGQSIGIRVPPSYRLRSGDFVNTLMALRVDAQFGPEYARRYVQELEATPGLSGDIAWCLEAVGRPAVPFLSKLYDHPELMPRMAALRAGARLEDPKAGAYLQEIALNGRNPITLRAEAAELMGDLPFDARTDVALRQLADCEDLEVRVAAYESMNKRRDPEVLRLSMGSGGAFKFRLDVVPAKNELIYVTQQGEPRIVVFGERVGLYRPLLASIWGDRMLLAGDSESEDVRVLYRDGRSGRAVQANTGANIVDVVRLLARRATPENPEVGLDLSYSQVVGALYELQKQGAIQAAFAVERDRIADRLLAAKQELAAEDRPESARKAEEAKERAKVINPVQQPRQATEEEKKSWVVPLNYVPVKPEK